MDLIVQAADALAASSVSIANAPKKDCAFLKIERRLDKLDSKLELILSLLKEQKSQTQKTQKEKILQTRTRSVMKLASKTITNVSSSAYTTRRTSKTCSQTSASVASPPSVILKPIQTVQRKKNKEYYEKYPEIKKKYWGVGAGRRSSSIMKKMDELIAQLNLN